MLGLSGAKRMNDYERRTVLTIPQAILAASFASLNAPVSATIGIQNYNTYMADGFENIQMYQPYDKKSGEVLTTIKWDNEKPKGISVFDIMQDSQKFLGIGKQHLAKIFQMSRQNYYNLQSNIEQIPNEETSARAEKVSGAIEIIKNEAKHKLGASTMTYKINRGSLLDVLIADDINLEKVSLFVNKINERISNTSKARLPEHMAKKEDILDEKEII